MQYTYLDKITHQLSRMGVYGVNAHLLTKGRYVVPHIIINNRLNALITDKQDITTYKGMKVYYYLGEDLQNLIKKGGKYGE